MTGFSDVLADLSGKYVELARELGGQQATVDYLWHTEWPDGQRRHDATELAALGLIDAANKYRLGTIYGFPIAARDGALVAYGPDYVDMYRQAGTYVARILKGEKPANLPVVEPTKFVMVIKQRPAIGDPFTSLPRPDTLRDRKITECVRQKARSACFGDYIHLMSSQEKAALTVLIVDRQTAEKRVVQVGGEWIKAASFKSVLDSVPRRFGFGEPGYDFVIMRRFARADNGASAISAEAR